MNLLYFLITEHMTQAQQSDIDVQLEAPREARRRRVAIAAQVGGEVKS